jgi:hypothetical protein
MATMCAESVVASHVSVVLQLPGVEERVKLALGPDTSLWDVLVRFDIAFPMCVFCVCVHIVCVSFYILLSFVWRPFFGHVAPLLVCHLSDVTLSD